MHNNNISPEILRTIWDAQGLGKIEHLVQPTGGAVNRCFIVNDAHVIRFDVLDDWDGINRYAGEKWAYDTLRDSDVPVPQVVVLDARKRLAPYDYLILTKVPGETVSKSLGELTPAAQQQLAYTAGQYLATLHNHVVDGMGLLFEIAAGINKPTWAEYVADFYAAYGQQSLELGLLPPEIWTRIQTIMTRMQALLASVQQGRFNHGDYHYANILQEDGAITGVLDFEWALSGDVSWDFRIDDQLESESPGGKAAFYAGYTSRRALPDQHWERVAFYRIGLYLDHLATFAPNDPEEIATLLPLLLKELVWLETHL